MSCQKEYSSPIRHRSQLSTMSVSFGFRQEMPDVMVNFAVSSDCAAAQELLSLEFVLAT